MRAGRHAAPVAEHGADVGNLADLLEEVADVDDPEPLARSRPISANRRSTSARCRLLVGSSISTIAAVGRERAADLHHLLRGNRQLPDEAVRPQLRVREVLEQLAVRA